MGGPHAPRLLPSREVHVEAACERAERPPHGLTLVSHASGSAAARRRGAMRCCSRPHRRQTANHLRPTRGPPSGEKRLWEPGGRPGISGDERAAEVHRRARTGKERRTRPSTTCADGMGGEMFTRAPARWCRLSAVAVVQKKTCACDREKERGPGRWELAPPPPSVLFPAARLVRFGPKNLDGTGQTPPHARFRGRTPPLPPFPWTAGLAGAWLPAIGSHGRARSPHDGACTDWGPGSVRQLSRS